jgi:hypothetical protein
MAYESDELGGREVYVRPFPNVHANRWQVSIDGGTAPRWSTDGQELFYFVDETGLADHIMAVRFDVAGATFRADAPRPLLLEGDHPSSPAGLFYDVRPDGLGFIVLRQSRGTTEEDRGRFIIAQNWIEEVKRLMPTE